MVGAPPRAAGFVADSFGRLGWKDGALYAISRVLRRVPGANARLVKYYFVAQPVPRTMESPAPGAGSIFVAAVREGDPLVAHFPRPPEVIARRYADGAICLAAQGRQGFAGFLWITFGPYDEDEVRCRFVTLPAQTTSWDFDVYVDPAFRMGRAFIRLWQAANACLRERKVEWTLSRISAFNDDSLRSHARLGGMRIASAAFLCVGSIQVTVASVRPWLHVSFSPASQPALMLRAPGASAF